MSARRTLLASKRWVVHLCSGKMTQNDVLTKWSNQQGCEILNVDVLNKGGKGWNLTDPDGPWSVLLWAAAAGRISAILSSAPSRTWSGGQTEPDQPWQRTHVDPWCQGCTSARTVHENLLFIQDMFLWTVASVARGGGIPFVKEFPDAKRDDGFGFWELDVWHRFQQWSGVKRSCVEVGKDCHGAPTHLSLGTNLRLPEAIHPPRGVRSGLDRKWTTRFKLQIIYALEGRSTPVDLEALDKKITEGMKSIGYNTASEGNTVASSLRNDQVPESSLRPSEEDQEEQLIRMFEDESVVSSSEESTCALCVQLKRLLIRSVRRSLSRGGYTLKMDTFRIARTATTVSWARP